MLRKSLTYLYKNRLARYFICTRLTSTVLWTYLYYVINTLVIKRSINYTPDRETMRRMIVESLGLIMNHIFHFSIQQMPNLL